jgi:tetratricopeptide (TPR) repeat protein
MTKVNEKRHIPAPQPKKSPAKKKDPSRPVWQSPFFWLILLPVVLYIKIVFFDFTALDDQFFVVDQASFNQDSGNLFSVFNRGLFVPQNDVYYRPIFLIDLILENQLFGSKPWGYHLTSLVFHLLSVCLLFVFLKRIRIPEIPALLLALLFSVHPVLTQTVAWIPGRNDLILMIFFLTTLILVIDYCRTPRLVLFIAQFITFLLALLTKETAVAIPVIAILLLRFVFSVRLSKMLPLFGSWVLALFIWYGLRATSDPMYQGMLFQEMITSGITRLPAILQYLGKIFFPVNLSAIPQLEDITLVWGIIALALLVGLVALSKSFRKPLVIIGLLWYLIFLIPVLIIPKNLNDQVYEHRLYLPFVGVLLILSQTILFSERWKQKYIYMAAAGMLLMLLIVSFIRLDCYSNKQVFWDTAAKDSPSSAFVKLNQGIQSKDMALREKYIRHAYSLDSTRMLVNYWMGITAERNNKKDSAEYFYKKELAYSNFPDLYFNLSRCLFELNKLDSAAWYLSKGIELEPARTAAVSVLASVYFKLAESAYHRAQYDSAAHYLRQVTTFDPKNQQANHNLAMVYFITKQKAKGLQVMESMKMAGLPVSQDLFDLAK